MLANYTTDPNLFDRCINLMDSVFPGIKNFAISGIKYNARWDRVSVPFIVEIDGQVVAHAGIIPFDVMLNKSIRKIAALHGICVKESFRRQGFYKQLMREALEYIEKNFDAAILFTNKPDLYKCYNFRALPEYDFVVNSDTFDKKASDIKILNLDNQDELLIIQKLLTNYLPASNQFGIFNESFIFILDHLSKNIYFSPSHNALLSYEVINRVLYLRYIISQNQDSLHEIIALIPEQFDKVIIQYCPDKFKDYTYTPILAKPADGIMVSENFNFSGDYFRYPEPYRC